MPDKHAKPRPAMVSFALRLPLAFFYILMFFSYIAFITAVVACETLIRRRQVVLFISQIIIFHMLFVLSITSYIVASTRNPLEPNLVSPDAHAEHDARPSSAINAASLHPSHVDDDDVPLRFLRNPQWVTSRVAKDRPSPLPLKTPPKETPSEDDYESDGSYYSPFPLGYSPVVFDQPADPERVRSSGEGSPLLTSTERDPQSIRPLTAKESNGGRRWCRKCDNWKPDRSHHCSTCRQCVLKMDHHCPWVGNCVGMHNYKAFLLFVTYMPILSAYVVSQAGLEVYHLFGDDAIMKSAEVCLKGVCGTHDVVRIEAVVCMLVAIVGAFFTMMIGALAGYHWWLACTNKTTLEDISHAFPTALLEEWENEAPVGWRNDASLTRNERNRLRSTARDINVYDLGWRVNLTMVLLGDAYTTDLNPGSFKDWRLRLRLAQVVKALSPLHRPQSINGGLSFPYNPYALDRLKRITREVRLGVRLVEESSK